jgi:ADP-L-glycero-D-manno-heptose 6-epimerase
MKVILTGASGFIGKNLRKKLQDLNFEVAEINEDIFDSESWSEELNRNLDSSVDAIFHVGACSNTLEQDVNYIMKVNYEFTKQIAICAEKLSIPLIYSSSAACYGTNNLYPSNLYGWSKYAAEDYVVNSGGIALRYFNVYGPGEEDKANMASFVYQAFIKFRNYETVKLFPTNPRRDFVYVDDVISANVHAFSNFDALDKRYYEVGSGEDNLFESALDYAGIDFEYHDATAIPGGYQFYTKSIPSNWMSGWKPQFDLESGIRSYIKYLVSSDE